MRTPRPTRIGPPALAGSSTGRNTDHTLAKGVSVLGSNGHGTDCARRTEPAMQGTLESALSPDGTGGHLHGNPARDTVSYARQPADPTSFRHAHFDLTESTPGCDDLSDVVECTVHGSRSQTMDRLVASLCLVN